MQPFRPITILAGHCGSGKTEVAVNFALWAASKQRVNLVDLDIINPYFCSRERRSELEAAGVRLIAPSTRTHNADLPALPAEVARIFSDPQALSIVDLGGDAAGAHILGRYRPWLEAAGPSLWVVLNANRPQTATLEGALAHLRAIESQSALRCDGLIQNTHLCGRTTAADLRRGAALAAALSEKTGVPIVCHTATQAVFDAVGDDLPGDRFALDIQMKKPWE